MLCSLTGRHVVTRTSRIDLGGRLPQTEAALVAQAVPHRVREFTTTRILARRALRGLGLQACPIPALDRAPVWPAGVVGSLTHCTGYRAAAVGRTRDIVALGIDAEPLARLDAAEAATILSPSERRLLDDQAVIGFSAKEALFKAWWPSQHRFLEFDDAEIVSVGAGLLRVRVAARLDPPPPFTDSLTVRWGVDRGLVLCALTIRRTIGEAHAVRRP